MPLSAQRTAGSALDKPSSSQVRPSANRLRSVRRPTSGAGGELQKDPPRSVHSAWPLGRPRDTVGVRRAISVRFFGEALLGARLVQGPEVRGPIPEA